MTKPALGGIKTSSELVLLKLHFDDSDGSVPDLCRLFSDHRINLPYLSFSRTEEATLISVCVDVGDESAAFNLIKGHDFLKARCRIQSGLGLLSIYPSKSSFELLGRSLMVLSQAGIGIHGWVSSLSSLSFLCDFSKLPRAITAFETHMDLPYNKAPYVSNIRVRQTTIVKSK